MTGRAALRWGAVVAVLAASGAWAGWTLAVPRAVRTLPPGSALFYLDLAPVRRAGVLALSGDQPRGPAYAAFVHDSGFDFERDLDQIAVSMQGSVLQPEQTTAILIGRFSQQLDSYLAAHALRKSKVAGRMAYQFPGWARPNQPLTVIELSRDRLLVTNAGDAATVLPGLLPRRPAAWQHAFWSLPPLGYAAADVTADDAHQPEGLRGSRRWRAEVNPRTDGSLAVHAWLESDNAADAAATNNWLQAQVRQLAPILSANAAGGPGVSALLEHLSFAQQGNTLSLTLDLDPATLDQWRKMLAQRY